MNVFVVDENGDPVDVEPTSAEEMSVLAVQMAAEEREQKFTGESGMRPQSEARRYVYLQLVAMLDNELTDREGWVFGGMKNELDLRRTKKAVRDVIKEMKRKASR